MLMAKQFLSVGIFKLLCLLIVLMHAHGALMRYISSNNTRVSEVNTIGIETQATAIGCCTFCSLTDGCVTCSFQSSTGTCWMANFIDGKTSVDGWETFSKVCPKTWTLWESHCYIMPDTIKNFTESEASCVALGGNLVNVQSQGENDFLVNFLEGRSPKYGNVYIGLNDMFTEGDFRWTKDYSTPTFINFIPGKPIAVSPYDCVVLNNNTSLWFYEHCDHLMHSVCKREINEV